MDTAAEMAKGSLDGDTTWKLFDMLQNRWACQQIVNRVLPSAICLRVRLLLMLVVPVKSHCSHWCRVRRF
jgi:hypothetical protein